MQGGHHHRSDQDGGEGEQQDVGQVPVGPARRGRRAMVGHWPKAGVLPEDGACGCICTVGTWMAWVVGTV